MNKFLMILAACAIAFAACTKNPDSNNENPTPPIVDPGTDESVDKDFHVYLCFGQSNMEGASDIEDIDKTGVDDRFKVMTVSAADSKHLNREVGKWYTAAPPLCRWDTGLSPVDYFGRSMVSALPNNIKVGVVIVAMGGSGIDAFDKQNYKYYYNNADAWQKGLMDIYGGNPYAELVKSAKNAQKTGVIKGILLHQGETNNTQQDWPAKVQKIYSDLLTDLGLKANEVPLLAGETLYKDQGGVCWGHNDIIARLPDVIDNAHVISAAGCEGKDDFHFTSAGCRELGRRYAKVMLRLMGHTPADGLSELRVEGRYLKNAKGKTVNLHGFAQTYSPWFNERGTQWNNWDVNGCLRYNKGIIDKVLKAGWEMNFVRMHMDPYWSTDPKCAHIGHTPRNEGHECFSEQRFRDYLDQVFIPMAEYAVSKGLYVVLRPPGVCPDRIAVGDDYYEFLYKVWTIVSQHPKIKSNGSIMLELANEPIDILGTDGTYGSFGDGYFKNLNLFFQPIVDQIRQNAGNIIWVPGLAYQGSYSGYATYPIKGDNIGYAVHLYPGWMGSDGENNDGGSSYGGYEKFQQGWNAQVQPVADFAPVMITEMDWAPKKYESSWGSATTGTLGGFGFGANFKYIVDNCGNVSWLLFTEPHLLAKFKDEPGTPGNYTFLNDPEACPWPCFHWFKEYAAAENAASQLADLVVMDGVTPADAVMMVTGSSKTIVVKAVYADGYSSIVTSEAEYVSSNPSVISVSNGRLLARQDGKVTITVSFTGPMGDSRQAVITAEATVFPLVNGLFNPSIWDTGTFDNDTKTLITGQWGFGGWHYTNGIDLSGHKYLIVELNGNEDSNAIFRIFGENNYWGGYHADYPLGASKRIVVTLDEMYKAKDQSVKISPKSIYYVGFWSYGSKPIVINKVYLSDTL